MYVWSTQACMYVCMLGMYVCLYIKLSSKGVGPIPYEKRSVFERQFNFLRFVRGGTSRCPNMHTYMLSIHTYKLRNQKPSTGRGLLKNPPQGEGFWNIEHVCMYVCWACMYVCILNYRPRGWVQFLTKNVQYLNDNSIFWDLWGGVLPDALTYIHTSLAYIHTYIDTYVCRAWVE